MSTDPTALTIPAWAWGVLGFCVSYPIGFLFRILEALVIAKMGGKKAADTTSIEGGVISWRDCERCRGDTARQLDAAFKEIRQLRERFDRLLDDR